MKKSFPSLSILVMAVVLFACSSDDGGTVVGTDDDGSTAPLTLQLDWQAVVGGSGNDSPRSLIETQDGNLVVLGVSNSIDGNLNSKQLEVNDFWLTKMTDAGEVMWSKAYGGSKDDQGQQVVQTSDGGYAITGYAMSDDGDGSNNEGFHDNWILRLDSAGEIMWEKSFGYAGHDHSYDLVATDDGGFFFAGFLDVDGSGGEGNDMSRQAHSARHGVGEFWGTKIDANGNLEWRRYFGGSSNDRCFGVQTTADGGYLMVGASESEDFDITDSKGSYDFWVVKLSGTGEKLWAKSYGGTGIEEAQDVAKTHDGGFILAGNTFSDDDQVSENKGLADIWLVKIDADGEVVWDRSYGGDAFENGNSIRPTNDNGFIVCGNTRSANGDVSANFGENDIWVFKIDQNGTLEWERSFGGSDFDLGFDAIQTDDGNFVLVGELGSTDIENLNTFGGTDMLVTKLSYK